MKRYSKEFRSSIIAKMLPPNNRSVQELAQETGVPKDTLYYWRIKSQKASISALSKKPGADGLSSEDKFSIVVETASMNEHELNAYCRRKGLYPQQIESWRKQCAQANTAQISKADREQIRQQSQAIKKLESELRRKEKALAEAAALLVLKKKVQQIWGDPEDER